MKRSLLAVLATAVFVQCTQLPNDPLQVLVVEVTTTGSAPDLDGYVATVDGAQTQPVAADGTVTFSGLAAGDHLVELSGLASNCHVDGNPRTISLAPDGVAEASFAVVCIGSGGLIVQATTTGFDLDDDGFTVTVDGSSELTQAVGSMGWVVFEDLLAGQHSVALTDYEANCAVAGENPRVATVVEDGFALVHFAVLCNETGPGTPGTGSLVVAATTTGSSLDADGYWATVDGNHEQRKAVGPNGSVLFEGLAAGEHVVALTGVATNCFPEPSPRLVTVPESGVAQASFMLTCVGGGGLVVQATTTGSGVDADGYMVSVDGDAALTQAVGPNSSVVFEDLEPGEHALLLSGVADNCTVADPNPQMITVAADATVYATFTVTCAGAGALVVRATTTGTDVDPDGYTVSVDGNEAGSRTVDSNGSVLFEGLEPGEHALLLTGVATNCSVADSNPRTVTVAADATVQATFAVSCVAVDPPSQVGSLQVITTTTGADIDPDGYRATVDGNDAGSMTVDPNGSVVFEGLAAGEHSVRLSGVAANCSVADPNPRTVTVTAGAKAQATFAVSCVAIDPPSQVGSLRVEVTTTDCDPGTETYTVKLDRMVVGSVATNGSKTFENLAVGEHAVRLSGVGGNCMVHGSNPRTVWIEQDTVTVVTFKVVCRDD